MRQDRAQTLGEEIANSNSNSQQPALLAALIAAPYLVLQAVKPGDAATAVGATAFVASRVLLHSMSMLYHALRCPQGWALLGLVQAIASSKH